MRCVLRSSLRMCDPACLWGKSGGQAPEGEVFAGALPGNQSIQSKRPAERLQYEKQGERGPGGGGRAGEGVQNRRAGTGAARAQPAPASAPAWVRFGAAHFSLSTRVVTSSVLPAATACLLSSAAMSLQGLEASLEQMATTSSLLQAGRGQGQAGGKGRQAGGGLVGEDAECKRKLWPRPGNIPNTCTHRRQTGGVAEGCMRGRTTRPLAAPAPATALLPPAPAPQPPHLRPPPPPRSSFASSPSDDTMIQPSSSVRSVTEVRGSAITPGGWRGAAGVQGSGCSRRHVGPESGAHKGGQPGVGSAAAARRSRPAGGRTAASHAPPSPRHHITAATTHTSRAQLFFPSPARTLENHAPTHPPTHTHTCHPTPPHTIRLTKAGGVGV